MENETKFVDGLRVFKPREGAPDFVKLNFLATADQLSAWLLANKDSEGNVRFDLLKSKNDKLYLKLNDFKKEGAPQQPQRPAQPSYNAPSPDEDYSLQDEVLPEINTGRPEDDEVSIKDIPFWYGTNNR